MSGALAAPIPDNGCSSTDEQLLHASANGDQTRDDDVHSHIVELSESIDHEIRNNTWKKNSPKKKTTIFRVPKERLHAADKITYQPVFLSIGPYHSGINATEEMRRNEQGKLCILNSSISADGGQSVLEYMKAVEFMEASARICYEGDVKMDRDAFCRMLLLDAFQLIALLDALGSPRQEMIAEAAAAAAGGATATTAASSQGGSGIKSRDLSMTVHDFLMLENQIPFFVVEKIYELHYYGNTNNTAASSTNNNGNATRRPVRELAWNTMQAIMVTIPPAPNHDQCLEYQHLVHVCHAYLKPTCPNVSTETPHQKQTGNKQYGRFKRATEYYDAGVKFRQWCREASTAAAAAAGGGGGSSQQQRPMLDVTFTSGVLSIALQKIDEKTGYILRNVLAYEQKYLTATSAKTSYVTAYVVFMSQLLGSAEDVALLSRRGVMEHLLGTDDEVCALFRGLAAGLFFNPDSEHYLKPVGMALQEHCSYRPYRWRAWIVRHRFGNPWLVAAWLFGAAAVLCTIIQTVFTVLSYVNPGQPHA